MSEHAKNIIDAASVGATVATLAGWLPAIAALVSIIWGCIRIYESRTVQRWVRGDDYDRREDQ